MDGLRKQELFGEVNDRIAELLARAWPTAPGDFLCECGRGECVRTVTLGLPEYLAHRERGEPLLARHESRGMSRMWLAGRAASGRPVAST